MARTKEFDVDQAIDQALEVFWVNGFERASLTQLTEATGLHKGSLYGTFKSKEQLFKTCLDRYLENNRTAYRHSGLEPKAYLEGFFARKLSCSKSRKAKGCMLMNSCIEFAGRDDGPDKKHFDKLLGSVQANLKEAVTAGVERGQFVKNLNPDLVSERLLALAFTIEEMGKAGRSRAFLQNISNGVLKELDIEI